MIKTTASTVYQLAKTLDYMGKPVMSGVATDAAKMIVELSSRIAELEAQNKRLVEALGEYINNFDDESIPNESLKNWLDEEWIPDIRALLAEVEK